MINTNTRLKITKFFLLITSTLLFFWWPLSHWFYSTWYHTILGFETWNESLVKIIGTCGIFPVLIMFTSGLNPAKNRVNIFTIVVFFFLFGLTFLYLTISGAFPVKEYINVGLCFFSSIFLFIIYPKSLEA